MTKKANSLIVRAVRSLAAALRPAPDLQALRGLSPHLLRDLGLSRWDVEPLASGAPVGESRGDGVVAQPAPALATHKPARAEESEPVDRAA